MNNSPLASSRRDFLRLGAGAALGAAMSGLPLQAAAAGKRPNVLFVSIDDMNDYAQPFGGYSSALTPHMQRLASQGVAFQRAYCAAPYCGASRSSVMSGVAPYRSGLTYQQNIIREEDCVRARLNLDQLMTIPRYFKSKGYRVMGGGKLYHGGFGSGKPDASSPDEFDAAAWNDYFFTDFSEIARTFSGVRNYRDGRTAAEMARADQSGLQPTLDRLVGADYNTPEQEAMMPDKLLAQWAVQKLREAAANPEQAFFLGVGLFRPHISLQVPQRFYNLYPLDAIRVPPFEEQLADLEDLPPYALKYLVHMDWSGYDRRLADGSPSFDHAVLQQMPARENRSGHAQAIQAYLASLSFADECLGQILSELDRSGLRGNTIVVLWSDHGWFLGEKLGWQKYKLWEKATRVPLIISAPGAASGSCQHVVSLLDLFPTLVDLVEPGTSAASQFSGRSLRPLLYQPESIWDDIAVTTQIVPESNAAAFHSLRTERWRYISYPPMAGATLSEELYDMTSDPQEKRNLLYWEPDSYLRVRNELDLRLKAWLRANEAPSGCPKALGASAGLID